MSDFDTIADALYARAPEEFTSARDAAIKEARAEKNANLARELGKLRKPTQSAWLINLLWRDQREVMEQMLQLGEELSHAQASASAPALQRLTSQRRELEAALIRRARELADKADVTVTAQMEREAQETLAAALARPDVADEVRSGRLVKPASYAGFGEFPATLPPRSSSPAAPEKDTEEEHVDEVGARRKRERREAAERRVGEARTDLRAAARALEEEEQTAQTARERHQDLSGRIEQVREQLAKLEKEAAAVEREALNATRSREHAERAHAAAERSLERAEQELAELDAD